MLWPYCFYLYVILYNCSDLSLFSFLFLHFFSAVFFFFFNDTAPTEIYTLSLHDALPILATIGSAVRVGVIQLARAAGIESLIAMIALGEPIAYAIMGALSARLPLPTAQYVVAAPLRLPAEDERVDVIFSAVLIVPFLVLLIAYGWLEHGLVGAAAWSLTSLAPHGLVQLLIRRRHLLDDRH